MRAGRLDRSITIQRSTYIVDDTGNPAYDWTDLTTQRAEIIQASTEEFIRAYGAADETVTIFRLRFFDGITNADRVLYAGMAHNIKEVKEIGRRKGLEIRTVAIGET
jgi:SPP1 family predicted phage head-tail adaptor